MSPSKLILYFEIPMIFEAENAVLYSGLDTFRVAQVPLECTGGFGLFSRRNHIVSSLSILSKLALNVLNILMFFV